MRRILSATSSGKSGSSSSSTSLQQHRQSHVPMVVSSKPGCCHPSASCEMLLMVEMNSLRLQVIIEVAMFKLMLVQTSHHLYLFLPICIPCRQGLPLV
ncbi:hypothetical protein V6Z12_D02G173400 [Gossypium hirsutum]